MALALWACPSQPRRELCARPLNLVVSALSGVLPLSLGVVSVVFLPSLVVTAVPVVVLLLRLDVGVVAVVPAELHPGAWVPGRMTASFRWKVFEAYPHPHSALQHGSPEIWMPGQMGASIHWKVCVVFLR